MELVNIVDESGNNTGQIVDRKTVQDSSLLHWEVVIFLINDMGQMLLEMRSPNKRFNPNKWAPCAGGVVAGENLFDAALRELEEELGIEVLEEDLNVLEENDNLTRFYYVFCNKKEEEFIIQKEELSCVKWYDISEVIEMIKNRDSITIKEDKLYLLERLNAL